MSGPTIAIVGARWPGLSVELEVLARLGARIREADGSDARELHGAIEGADVVLAGPAPRLDEAALSAFGGSNDQLGKLIQGTRPNQTQSGEPVNHLVGEVQ